MDRDSLFACLAVTLMGFCAISTATASDEVLRTQLKLPYDAVIKPWPGVADRTLVAYAAYRDKTESDGENENDTKVDLTVLVLKSSTGDVVQRTKLNVGDDDDVSGTGSLPGISLDTANYALRPGNRAFGVRVRFGYAHSCSETEHEDLHLFDILGKNIKQVTTINTYLKEGVHACGTPDGEETETKTTIQIADTSTQGYADLLLHEAIVVVDDNEDGVASKRSSKKMELLRFDEERDDYLPASLLRADAVLAEIKAKGAQAVVYALGRDWNKVTANIGRGDQDWLKVAVALRPGTDPGRADSPDALDLDEAMFFALRSTPTEVLQLLKDGTFEVRAVCSPNIADGHHRLVYPPDEFRKFVGNRIKTLESLSNPDVQTVRDACLAALQGIFIDHAKQKHGSH